MTAKLPDQALFINEQRQKKFMFEAQDSLVKREKFSVSLRKQKRGRIIQAKRNKLETKNKSNLLSVRAASHSYQGLIFEIEQQLIKINGFKQIFLTAESELLVPIKIMRENLIQLHYCKEVNDYQLSQLFEKHQTILRTIIQCLTLDTNLKFEYMELFNEISWFFICFTCIEFEEGKLDLMTLDIVKNICTCLSYCQNKQASMSTNQENIQLDNYGIPVNSDSFEFQNLIESLQEKLIWGLSNLFDNSNELANEAINGCNLLAILTKTLDSIPMIQTSFLTNAICPLMTTIVLSYNFLSTHGRDIQTLIQITSEFMTPNLLQLESTSDAIFGFLQVLQQLVKTQFENKQSSDLVFIKWIPIELIISLIDIDGELTKEQAQIMKEAIKTLNIILRECASELEDQTYKAADLLQFIFTKNLIEKINMAWNCLSINKVAKVDQYFLNLYQALLLLDVTSRIGSPVIKCLINSDQLVSYHTTIVKEKMRSCINSYDIQERTAASYLLMDLITYSSQNENQALCNFINGNDFMSQVSANLTCVNSENQINLVLLTLNVIQLVFTRFPANQKQLFGVDFTEVFEKSGGIDALEMIQYHTNQKVFEAAQNLCKLHFQIEDSEEIPNNFTPPQHQFII